LTVILIAICSTHEYVDFGVDQLDIKKKMKPKLGSNIILRLKLDFSAGGALTTTGTGGYTRVTLLDDTDSTTAQARRVEMVNVVTNNNHNNKNTNSKASNDSEEGLLSNNK
jgi:hypothetical protein